MKSSDNTDVIAWLRGIAEEVENNPERWTQGDLAKDAKGNACSAYSDDAVCWCAEGFTRRDRKESVTDVFYGVVWMTNDGLESSTEFVQWFRAVAEVLENCDKNA